MCIVFILISRVIPWVRTSIIGWVDGLVERSLFSTVFEVSESHPTLPKRPRAANTLGGTLLGELTA